eukprot:Tbor_TRINITY_DN9992_c0_g1::TRINITY_DN9992_c0_g1_i1::g.17695::m.17695
MFIAATNNNERLFSSMLWDLFRTTIGFSKSELDSFRSNQVARSKRPIIEADCLLEHQWTDATTIERIRRDIDDYLSILSSLNNETESRRKRKFKTKSFVEDTRYCTLRAREAAKFIDAKSISRYFNKIDLSGRGVSSIDNGIHVFTQATQLILSDNNLNSVDFLPTSLKVFICNNNRISSFLPNGRSDTLVFLSLVDNCLNSLNLLAATPSLVVLDVSFNQIVSLENVIQPILDYGGSLRELTLLGNPAALHPLFRIHLREMCPGLIIDGQDDVFSPLMLPNDDSHIVFRINLHKISGFISAFDTPAEEPNLPIQIDQKPAKVKTDKGRTRSTPSPVGMAISGSSSSRLALLPSWLIDRTEVEFKIHYVDLPSTHTHLEEPKVTHKGGKNAKKGTQENYVPIPPTALIADELLLNFESVSKINPYPTLVYDSLRPLIVKLSYAQDAGPDDFIDDISMIGSFEIYLSPLLASISGGNGQQVFDCVHCQPNEVYFQYQSRKVLQATEKLNRLIEMDHQLHIVLRDINEESSINPSQQPQITKKSRSTSRIRDSLRDSDICSSSASVQLQHESQNRKMEIEELRNKIQTDSKRLEKLKMELANVTISGEVEINPFPPLKLDSNECRAAEKNSKTDTLKKKIVKKR